MNSRALGGYSYGMMKRRTKKKKTELLEAIGLIVPPKQTIIEFGAGTGRYVQALGDLGYSAFGLDGGEGVEELSEGLVQFCDLSVPNTNFLRKNICHWGLFTEVGEHIPAEFESIVVENITRACKDGVIVTWATPGQRGHHHVNCRSVDYVVGLFNRCGFCVNNVLQKKARKKVKKRRMRQKLLVMTSPNNLVGTK